MILTLRRLQEECWQVWHLRGVGAESKAFPATEEGHLHLCPCPCDATSSVCDGRCQGGRNLLSSSWGKEQPSCHTHCLETLLLLHRNRTQSCLKLSTPPGHKKPQMSQGHQLPQSLRCSERGSPENQKPLRGSLSECLSSDSRTGPVCGPAALWPFGAHVYTGLRMPAGAPEVLAEFGWGL
ncbi:hypothetical protein VULLAG_LOCUS6056 [Vulpes lagopus]